MKSIASLLTVLALGTSLASAADEKPATPSQPETTAPATKPEAATGKKPKRDPAKMFGKLDANNDGKISEEEWKGGRMAKRDASKADQMFSRRDKDGDKSLTLEEFSARGKKKKNQ